MKTLYCLLVILCLTLSLSSSAQDAYKWTDKSGRVIYGNKSPKEGNAVTSIKTRELSKYSSTGVLKHMGTDIPTKTMPEGTYTSKGSKATSEPKSIVGAGELLLETEQVIVTKNEDGQFTSVKVKVINPNDKDALDVSVAFKFSDGQLVPAEGPFEVPAKENGEYKIPDELLPVELKAGSAPDAPKAITHGLSM